jgi:hypothetical protein
MTAVDVLHAVKQAGGRLLPNGDKLIIEAPMPLPTDVITLVCQHKSALLALLHQEPPALPSAGPGQLTSASPPWERHDACYACGATRRWRSIYGVLLCVRCHPPPDAALVVAWEDIGEAGKDQPYQTEDGHQ